MYIIQYYHLSSHVFSVLNVEIPLTLLFDANLAGGAECRLDRWTQRAYQHLSVSEKALHLLMSIFKLGCSGRIQIRFRDLKKQNSDPGARIQRARARF